MQTNGDRQMQTDGDRQIQTDGDRQIQTNGDRQTQTDRDRQIKTDGHRQMQTDRDRRRDTDKQIAEKPIFSMNCFLRFTIKKFLQMLKGIVGVQGQILRFSQVLHKLSPEYPVSKMGLFASQLATTAEI